MKFNLKEMLVQKKQIQYIRRYNKMIKGSERGI